MIWVHTADPNMQSLIQYILYMLVQVSLKKKKKNLGSSLGKFCSAMYRELQWLEHQWLFELVLEFLGKNPIAADIIILGII